MPSELRRWPLAASSAGRIGGVRAELIAEAGTTRLGDCYQQVPLQVLPPFQFAPGRPTLLYLLNPTAGLMDGDGQLVRLTARAGSRAIVVGQSATRIHPSLRGCSTQQWRLHVERGAVLVVLPGPAIPFRGCRYYQRVEVELEPGAGFLWGDIWLPGRYSRGADSERFQFDCLVQELLIRRAGRLVFRDRSCWRGPWDPATAAWHFSDSTACGSLFGTGPAPPEVEWEPIALDEARFETASGDTCCRWRGSSEAVTGRLVEVALRWAAELARDGNRPWLSPDDLAPAHWFSQGVRARPVRE